MRQKSSHGNKDRGGKMPVPPAPVHLANGPVSEPVREEDEPPPFCGTWPRLYAAIVGYLATLITLFYLFTRAYRIT
ncbi:MAG: hypothetical protein EXQ56_10005 [Acidobacteria bacterium]|nr:hypothetical protein [Acidobacteriota bacterium]